MKVNKSPELSLVFLFGMTLLIVTSCRLFQPPGQDPASLPTSQTPTAGTPQTTVRTYKLSSFIEIYRLDEVLSAYKVLRHYQIHFEEEKPDVSWMIYERRYSRASQSEYTRKDSLWLSYEFLKFEEHKNSWYREPEDKNWHAPPIEIHDPTAMEIYKEIDRLKDTPGWKKSGREEVNGIQATHYTYQAEVEFPLPSAALGLIHPEKIPWKESSLQSMTADVWIADEGYVAREAFVWNVRYTFPDGRQISGKEIITTDIKDINQPVSIPSLDVPPIPPPVNQFDRGKWIEYGWKDDVWAYQTVVEQEDVLQAYREHDGEGYTLLEVDSSPEEGIRFSLETQDGIHWQVEITQRETEKNSLVYILSIHQQE